MPGIGDGPANDIRTKHATLHYWQKDYAAVIPQQTDPVGSVPQDNPDLQLVVANAVYRTAQSKMKDKEIDDRGARSGHPVVRHRAQELPRATRTPPSTSSCSSGCATSSTRASASPDPRRWCSKDPTAPRARRRTIDSSMSDFKIYIPLESQERQDQGVAGKAAAGKRKG